LPWPHHAARRPALARSLPLTVITCRSDCKARAAWAKTSGHRPDQPW
jgi:hypothetical protein